LEPIANWKVSSIELAPRNLVVHVRQAFCALLKMPDFPFYLKMLLNASDVPNLRLELYRQLRLI
jgi:hypothetical protein